MDVISQSDSRRTCESRPVNNWISQNHWPLIHYRGSDWMAYIILLHWYCDDYLHNSEHHLDSSQQGHISLSGNCQKPCRSAMNAILWRNIRCLEHFYPSVYLSVRPPVCYTFFTMFLSLYHHDIFRNYYHWQTWCPCKRSRSEVKGQSHRGHDPI